MAASSKRLDRADQVRIGALLLSPLVSVVAVILEAPGPVARTGGKGYEPLESGASQVALVLIVVAAMLLVTGLVLTIRSNRMRRHQLGYSSWAALISTMPAIGFLIAAITLHPNTW